MGGRFVTRVAGCHGGGAGGSGGCGGTGHPARATDRVAADSVTVEEVVGGPVDVVVEVGAGTGKAVVGTADPAVDEVGPRDVVTPLGAERACGPDVALSTTAPLAPAPATTAIPTAAQNLNPPRHTTSPF